MAMKTTLNKIREHSPCKSGWEKLLSHLGKTHADDEPLSLLTIIDSNGVNDALWCLRAVENHDREIRLYSVWCARQVQHLVTDQRSLDGLDVAERFANGEATQDELAAAYAAAYAAAAAYAVAAAYATAADAADAYAAAYAAAAYAAYAAARAAQKAELSRVCAAIDAGQDPYPRKMVQS
ncbi:MAG: hypothetical protein JJU29_24000 [Verrucomicrobia bacterium]|nr:hypothetical protein [Verrucomicrobiota bacterium]